MGVSKIESERAGDAGDIGLLGAMVGGVGCVLSPLST